MKRIVLPLVAAGLFASAAVPAFAQGPRPSDWQPLSQRQDMIERRIDRGLANGQLTRVEARGLRQEFRDLMRLERRYRRDGLSLRERADLQHRYDLLAARVRFERRDDQTRYYPAGRR